MRNPFDDFVGKDSTPLFENATGNAKKCHLLWGDGVEIVSRGSRRTNVRARGRESFGWVNNSDLGGDSLLEFYYIDVGQGDGVLIKTPDFRHVLIDGGFQRSVQDTGKNAADFVDWKFFHDYKKRSIELDVMMATHNDADHYGGLWDLLNPAEKDELDTSNVRVEAFYHAGLAWWKGAGGRRELGPDTRVGDELFFTRLMRNRRSVMEALGSGSGPKLQGLWAKFLKSVVDTRKKNGRPTSIKRLSHVDRFVPGFESNDLNGPAIRVLAPVEFDIGARRSAIRKFSGGTSKNTNGNSLLLRFDFGRTRSLLTGDLNFQSMKSLLADYAGERLEFKCDVAKACHHGSDDISYEFLQAMEPAVTVISSGDNEGHDHPRPSVIAASATTGYLKIRDDALITPLVYSTELARSLDLGVPTRFEQIGGNNEILRRVSGAELKRSKMHIKKCRKKFKFCRGAMIAGDLIYGLVNVRTDGEKILCATLDEQDSKWKIKTIQSRF